MKIESIKDFKVGRTMVWHRDGDIHRYYIHDIIDKRWGVYNIFLCLTNMRGGKLEYFPVSDETSWEDTEII